MRRNKSVLKEAFAITAISAIATGVSSPAALSAPRDFVGTWVNTNRNTSGITRMIVRSAGRHRLSVQVFGQCQPQDCNWGRTNLITYGNNVQDRNHKESSAIYHKRFANTFLTMRLTPQSRINLKSFTQFTDGSNRENYFSQANFRRAGSHGGSGGGSGVREDCVRFNPRTTRLRRINNSWKIVDGSHSMFNFGNKLGEARKSLRVIKRYGANKSCFVGRPQASLKYLLVNNTAPTGRLSREDCVAFNPDTTRVKRVNNRWKLVDRNHLLFDFGNKRSEARKSLAIIRKHNFRKSCFIGRPDPSFTYLRR